MKHSLFFWKLKMENVAIIYILGKNEAHLCMVDVAFGSILSLPCIEMQMNWMKFKYENILQNSMCRANAEYN